MEGELMCAERDLLHEREAAEVLSQSLEQRARRRARDDVAINIKERDGEAVKGVPDFFLVRIRRGRGRGLKGDRGHLPIANHTT